MPMTFLSHQAVVLPLKIAAPRVTSGTALVLGSMAPDVEYFVRGYATSTISHTALGQLTFCLPVTLALYWVVTRVIAEPAAAHVPRGGELRLSDYGLLRQQPGGLRHLPVVAVSALIGSSSHVALDRMIAAMGGMPYHSMSASRGWIAANLALWLLLAGVTILCMRYIGRNRLVQRWAAERSGGGATVGGAGTSRDSTSAKAFPTVDAQRDRSPFWSWVVFGMVAGAVLAGFYRRDGFYLNEFATWVHIWLCAVSGAFVALVLASAAWHGARARSVHLRRQQQ